MRMLKTSAHLNITLCTTTRTHLDNEHKNATYQITTIAVEYIFIYYWGSPRHARKTRCNTQLSFSLSDSFNICYKILKQTYSVNYINIYIFSLRKSSVDSISSRRIVVIFLVITTVHGIHTRTCTHTGLHVYICNTMSR